MRQPTSEEIAAAIEHAQQFAQGENLVEKLTYDLADIRHQIGAMKDKEFWQQREAETIAALSVAAESNQVH